MKRNREIVARLIQVVQVLGDLTDEFIFVGGSAVPLLVTDDAAPDARPTGDVDVVVQVFTRSEYHEIEKRLAEVGFHLDIIDGVICRFKHNELKLDVMLMDEDVLKFGNRWHKKAADSPIIHQLIAERAIKVINAPLFLCSKFDAYGRRGHEDEKDLEDIINVIDGRRELLEELKSSPPEIVKYIAESTNQQLNAGLAARLDWFLPTDAASIARNSIVLDRLNVIGKLGN